MIDMCVPGSRTADDLSTFMMTAPTKANVTDGDDDDDDDDDDNDDNDASRFLRCAVCDLSGAELQQCLARPKL